MISAGSTIIPSGIVAIPAEIGDTTASAWDSVKTGFQKAYNSTKDGFNQAHQWMSHKIAP
jgi:hypothetical protein